VEIYGYYVDFIIDSVIEDLMKKYGYDSQEAWRMVYYGGLKIYSAVDSGIQKTMENVYENRVSFPKETSRTETGANKTKKKVQSSMVVMDYQGRVLGIVGGAGPKTENRSLNRAADSPRQPGSSIKPISVYSLALEKNNVYWSKLLNNYAMIVNGKRWPENYGGSLGAENSFVTLQYAIAQSLNTTSARVVKEMSPKKCLETLQNKFHITTATKNDADYSPMAVGGMNKGVTPLEMTAAYATFGNGGKYYKPYCYYKVTNNDGSITYLENSTKGEQAISSATADVMNELMRTVITSGTGRGYAVPGFTTFAKTGTTSDNYDRWFVGGTPHYVAAVWYGYDRNEQIRNVSGNPAGNIFRSVMNNIHKSLPKKNFAKSGLTVQRSYCTVTGLLANERCHSTAVGWYDRTKLPPSCTGCSMVVDPIEDTTDTTAGGVLTSSRPTTTTTRGNISDWISQIVGRN
jgi:penicillin-binding protein 1A